MVAVGEEDGERRTSHDAWSWRNRWQDGRCVEGHVIIYRFGALWQDTMKSAWRIKWALFFKNQLERTLSEVVVFRLT